MVTGDEYIGVTGDRGGLKQRCRHHKHRAKKGLHNHLPLYANINEYGWENFTARVLCEGDDEEYLCWLMRPSLNQLWKDDWTTPDEVRKKISKGNSKSVRCIETGEVFDKMEDAAKSVGVSGGMITMAVKGKRKTAGGYHWEYA